MKQREDLKEHVSELVLRNRAVDMREAEALSVKGERANKHFSRKLSKKLNGVLEIKNQTYNWILIPAQSESKLNHWIGFDKNFWWNSNMDTGTSYFQTWDQPIAATEIDGLVFITYYMKERHKNTIKFRVDNRFPDANFNDDFPAPSGYRSSDSLGEGYPYEDQAKLIDSYPGIPFHNIDTLALALETLEQKSQS